MEACHDLTVFNSLYNKNVQAEKGKVSNVISSQTLIYWKVEDWKVGEVKVFVYWGLFHPQDHMEN